jgi:hypothetical protein
MNIDWPAFQAWLSQPWVLALGVWVIAFAFAIGILVELVKGVAVVVRDIRKAVRAARSRRYWSTRQVRTVKVDGHLVKRVVPIGSDDGHG